MEGNEYCLDALDGRGSAAWRIPPTRFLDDKEGGRAFFMDWSDPKRVLPLVGDESWSNYEVAIEILPMSSEGYLGLGFHMQGAGEAGCNLHLPVSRSGWSDAFQSMGIWGENYAWKLYPEAQAYAIFPKARWIPIRIVATPDFANVYVHGSSNALLTFHDLPFSSGGVQLWSWGASGLFKNLRVTSVDGVKVVPAHDQPWSAYNQLGVLATWQVTPVAPSRGGELKRLGNPIEMQGDARGIVNLTPLKVRFPNVFGATARTLFSAPKSRRYLMHVTYTGRMWVWCNGTSVFAGPERGWSTPDREKVFGGRLIPDEFSFVLSLKRGQNEILLRCEDPEKWGWGFWTRLTPD